ncbi:MAG: sugar phosphate nucleotidyltransferase [Candidatus Omnitrophota bacterium]
MIDTDVFILCGGRGKRLRGISGPKPKSMMLINKRPLLDLLIDCFAKFGFKRIILGLGYKANYIKDYYRDNLPKGIEICFSTEAKPLGTGGALKKAGKLIKSGNFFVLNGDSLSKFNPLKMLRYHDKKNAQVTVLLKKMDKASQYGRVELDRNRRIVSYDEKIKRSGRCFINAGVYIFNKKILDLMPAKKGFSLEYDFFPSILGEGVFGFKYSGSFIDIGTPDRYRKAQRSWRVS